jgi:hypothetical protein
MRLRRADDFEALEIVLSALAFVLANPLEITVRCATIPLFQLGVFFEATQCAGDSQPLGFRTEL